VGGKLDYKSSACLDFLLEATKLFVEIQRERLVGSDTEETCMLAFLASWCFAAWRLSFLFLFSLLSFFVLLWMLNWRKAIANRSSGRKLKVKIMIQILLLSPTFLIFHPA
jgi:hypothetical protein